MTADWTGSRVSATLGHHADVAQLVERDLAKVEVAGSSPVVRSSMNVVVSVCHSEVGETS